MFDILAHASNYTTPTRGMRYAAQVANLLGSSLTGIFVSEPVVPMSPITMAPLAPEIYAAAAQVVQEALAFEPKFHEWARSVGLTRHKWQVATSFFSGALATAANWHDALVLECGTQMPWGSVGMLGNVLVNCGIPCFVVPETFSKPASFDSIAIASHGSPESIRAAHAALPLLKRAKHITLLQGRPREAFSSVDFRPAFTLEDHLTNHNLQFVTRVLDVADDRAGAEILANAGDVNADLLVMGAYGRARFSEWVLGGATHHVLGNAQLPLFMRH